MVYLTYNDSPSGIYSSQVIDVVNYINTLSGKKIKLVALISVRGFFKNRHKIKSACSAATVLPMFPKARYWKFNITTLFFLFLISPAKKIMARGPFATGLALRLKKIKLVKKVIFDARGAYTAELTEYDVVQDESIKSSIYNIEKKALEQSDFKLAVSGALVNYWKEQFNYAANNHVIIPCTLSSHFIFDLPAEKGLSVLKQQLGYDPQDILFVYSGSSAGWQSFGLVDDYMSTLMSSNSAIKLIILSEHFDEQYQVVKQFRDRVKITWVKQEVVKNYLLIADYGILYREPSVTNQVASPVKFAEYLSCGLKVLISDNLGDYSVFSKNNNCIFLKDDMRPLPYEEKTRIHHLSKSYFHKSNYRDEYLRLIEC